MVEKRRVIYIGYGKQDISTVLYSTVDVWAPGTPALAAHQMNAQTMRIALKPRCAGGCFKTKDDFDSNGEHGSHYTQNHINFLFAVCAVCTGLTVWTVTALYPCDCVAESAFPRFFRWLWRADTPHEHSDFLACRCRKGAVESYRKLASFASTMSRDPYRVLGVPYDARQEDIRSAYLRLAKRHHPDLNKTCGNADQFKAINFAWEVCVGRWGGWWGGWLKFWSLRGNIVDVREPETLPINIDCLYRAHQLSEPCTREVWTLQ